MKKHSKRVKPAVAKRTAPVVKTRTTTVSVKECPKCGSTQLVSPSLGSYSPETILIPGINEITGVKECVKCGYCGYPVEQNRKITVLLKKEEKESLFKRLKRKLYMAIKRSILP